MILRKQDFLVRLEAAKYVLLNKPSRYKNLWYMDRLHEAVIFLLNNEIEKDKDENNR